MLRPRDLSVQACLQALLVVTLITEAGGQPVIELDLFAVTDTTGTPNSNTPGTELPFFQPGETVRLTLRAANGGDGAPVRVTLDIASALDHGTLVYESNAAGEDNTTDSPLDSAETDYFSFDWTLPAHIAWGNYDVVGSIRSPDLSVLYDETAPGPSTTSFTDSAWHPAFTAGEFGTTVIVHGYQFTGTIPSWPGTMAEDLRDRIVRGRVWGYNPATAEFVVTSPYVGQAENILVFDWADASNDNFEGHSEAAAEGLFTALMAGASEPIPDWDIDHVHLIGHSRGAVVVSETAQRLLAAGENVGHLTFLDPVWQGAFGQASDFDVNANHPTLGTRGVAAWSTAGYVDNFYSTDDVHDDFLGIDGSPIDGARNLDLSGRGTGVGHSDTWRWYYGTIALDSSQIGGNSIETAWYGGAGLAREADGFNQTRLGGKPQSPMSGTTNPIEFGWLDDGIVNGDFERGPQGAASSTRPDPGWDQHGGGGPGVIETNHLVLQSGDEYRTHNRIWVPPQHAGIRYTYDTQLVAGGNPDTLVVYAVESGGALTPLDEVVLDGTPLTDTTSFSGASYASQVVTLRFEIMPGDASVGSTVIVDDVRFSDPPIGLAIDVEVFLEGAYSGLTTMTTDLNTAVPLSHPYSDPPWSYAGPDTVDAMPADVVDWVLVELRSDSSAATTAGRRVALLTNTGRLRDVSGSDSLAFPTVPLDEYYVVVRHRNHADVMSSGRVDMTSGFGAWDFTSELGSALGSQSPMKSLGDGHFGLFACDINADGQITVADFGPWLAATKAAVVGYQPSDCNLDSHATIVDFGLWLVNTKAAAASQVPE